MDELYAKLILFAIIAIFLIAANILFRRKIDKICQPPETDAAPDTSAVKEDFAKASALLEQENEKLRKLGVIAREKRTAERLQEIQDRKEREEILKNLSKPRPEPTQEEIEERQRIEAELAKRRKLEDERWEKRKQELEREEMEKKILERHRKRELEKSVRQNLIDRGLLYGEQTKRPHIPQEVVDAVYKRDGGRCVRCGSTENLQLDHIVPFSKGGATSVENLQLLCRKCNLEKSNKIG